MPVQKPKTHKSYDHARIEKKWQNAWKAKKAYKTTEGGKKQKCYVLDMFPYPSGQGLHVGHPRGYIASDVYARFMRMKGFNVLHPMGFDAFGLPAEQYAIANKIHPEQAVKKNIATYRKQLEIIGFSYDWSRAVNTTDPAYYKWTQWIFLKLYDAWYDTTQNKARPISELIRLFETSGTANVSAVSNVSVESFSAAEWKSFGMLKQQEILMKYRLAYEGFSEVNWCPQMGTVLANDEVVAGPDGKPVSERGGYRVVKKSLRQWFLRITAYAERLVDGLDTLDWPEHIKEIERNWIGKSEGSEIDFSIVGLTQRIKVFTTRADTLFGVTYLVLAPESALVEELLPRTVNKSEIQRYIQEIANKAPEDRINPQKEKTGLELKGIRAVNPATGETVPVWIADYVLSGYGTGAVMAVPAHDTRDYLFAKKYNLPIKDVVIPSVIDHVNTPRTDKPTKTRRNVHAIVFDPIQKKYLIIRNKKHGWDTVIIGGIEAGEQPLDAALRELREETGYVDLEFKKILGAPVRAAYFAKHKDENRVAYSTAIFFELKSARRVVVETGGENEGNEIVWVDEKDFVPGKMINSELPYWLERMKSNTSVYTGDGVLYASDVFDGLTSTEARTKITQSVGGKIVTRYKMRDAVFARQRYWGEPIPLIHTKEGMIVPLAEKDLPLRLPKVRSYQPIGTGESPLAGVSAWVKKGYETNTMPGWAASSWYFLRYMDPQNRTAFASKKSLKYWKQVDMYIGGAEHATGHLLYARFWNKFLYDLGLVVTDEPFKTLKNQGIVLGSDSRKMSKRWGNVVNPDEVVRNVGADTLRIYESFMGPFEQEIPWSTDSMVGSRRFLEKVWELQKKVTSRYKDSEETLLLLNQTIKKVEEDIQSFNANTAISSLMILANLFEKQKHIDRETYASFIKILSPFAPHIAEEIWSQLGKKKMIVSEQWPAYDSAKLFSARVNMVVQINGKMRATVSVPHGASQTVVEGLVLADPSVVKWLVDKKIAKKIFVQDKIINFVI